MDKTKALNLIRLIATIGWLIILFLISISFLDRINDIMVIFGIYSLALVVLYWEKITFNLEFILLVAFGTAYFFTYIRYNDYTKWTHIKYWLGAPLMYLAGKFFINRKTEKYFKWVIIVTMVGLFTYVMLSMISYLNLELEGVRQTQDFWAGHVIGATNLGVYIVSIGTLMPFMFFNLSWKKEYYLKIPLIIMFILSIYFTILLANRTYFIIILLTFLSSLVMEVILSKGKKIKLILTIIVAIVAFLILYNIDFLNIKTFIESTKWYDRYIKTVTSGFFNDARFKVYPHIIRQFFDYPQGGYLMDLGGLHYAHNLWLDVLYAVGNYPFYMLVAYSILTGVTLVRLILNKQIPTNVKTLVFGVFIAYTLQFMVEPIMEAVPYVFYLILLINGATYQYVKINSEYTTLELYIKA